MRKLGLTLILIGLLITLFSGFQFMTRKKVMDVGEIHITKNENHNLDWSPLVGIAVMVAGGIVMLIGTKKV